VAQSNTSLATTCYVPHVQTCPVYGCWVQRPHVAYRAPIRVYRTSYPLGAVVALGVGGGNVLPVSGAVVALGVGGGNVLPVSGAVVAQKKDR